MDKVVSPSNKYKTYTVQKEKIRLYSGISVYDNKEA